MATVVISGPRQTPVHLSTFRPSAMSTQIFWLMARVAHVAVALKIFINYNFSIDWQTYFSCHVIPPVGPARRLIDENARRVRNKGKKYNNNDISMQITAHKLLVLCSARMTTFGSRVRRRNFILICQPLIIRWGGVAVFAWCCFWFGVKGGSF